MALPMISEAREAYPGAHVIALTPQPMAELLRGNPAVDDVLTLPPTHVHGLKSVMYVKELLAPFRFEIGIIMPPSFGAAAGFKLGGVKERIGYIADGRRLLLSKPLPLPTPLNCQHRSVTYFELLRRATGKALEYVKPKLFLSQEDTDAAATMLRGFGIAEGQAYAAIAFRAVAASRRWGIERYAALAKRLHEEAGLAIVLIGGSDDARDGDKIIEQLAGLSVFNLAGKTSLRETAALLSSARLFVGNDSGPAHLAAAVGAPLVVLSGADDPKETSPVSERRELLRLAHLRCISCVKNSCPLSGAEKMRCMNDLAVDQVAAAALALLQRTA